MHKPRCVPRAEDTRAINRQLEGPSLSSTHSLETPYTGLKLGTALHTQRASSPISPPVYPRRRFTTTLVRSCCSRRLFLPYHRPPAAALLHCRRPVAERHSGSPHAKIEFQRTLGCPDTRPKRHLACVPLCGAETGTKHSRLLQLGFSSPSSPAPAPQRSAGKSHIVRAVIVATPQPLP